MLRKIECFLRPTIEDEESTDLFHDSQVKQIQKRLMEMDVPGMTVSRATGYGRTSESTPEGDVPMEKRLRIEVVLQESKLTEVTEQLKSLAEEGGMGAGKIFILPVEDAIRISTGESGRSAI